ncbi:DUF6512 family protein [Serpentinicella alkaliphila]|uniref:Uncharacterized protein n=1 Tax=Serpentinicella alkaliphila TaxID=1734049 RepID=A0A4R2TNV1_9FIRM|nr:DUF6512 family protein [Serpentinicella alkaliphila]QUH27093.1 hypothetical protein HZR23_16100 [Serpentinicella alkaliphila]TCQ05221.1 hypothetical protein EDD79_100536 [Serpentinicella alkaliphila]
MIIIRNFEIAGIFIIFIMSFLLHELYDMTGQNIIVGVFAPINESIWEHMKMGFFAVIFYSMIEYYFIRGISNNFFLAKGILVILLPAMIAIGHIVYTTILGRHIVLIDIINLFIWIGIGQLISYKILTLEKNYLTLNKTCLVFIIFMMLAYIVFTFVQPNLSIFQEPKTSIEK